jgi:hypothetical protein
VAVNLYRLIVLISSFFFFVKPLSICFLFSVVLALG